jgi:hypothetical protein
VPTELITVAETQSFIRQAESVWNEEERGVFIDYIARNPEAGDVIPDTGGIRKVRWGRQGSGKRGGTRIIYFFYDRSAPIYLLMVYAKSVRDDISPEAKKTLREFAMRIKLANRSGTERKNR